MAKIATVPKNIREIKTEFMFGLTIRQLCCFGLAGAAGIPVYFALRQFVGNDLATIVMVAVMFPFFFVALYEKDGMPAERILYAAFLQMVFSEKQAFHGIPGSVCHDPCTGSDCIHPANHPKRISQGVCL